MSNESRSKICNLHPYLRVGSPSEARLRFQTWRISWVSLIKSDDMVTDNVVLVKKIVDAAGLLAGFSGEKSALF